MMALTDVLTRLALVYLARAAASQPTRRSRQPRPSPATPARGGVEVVVVPELHVTSIVGLMAGHGDIRTGRHRVFDSVFGTMYRHPVSTARHLDRMEQIMRVCGDFECELAEFNGEANHVHLLVRFPPKVALLRRVNSRKGVSSRRLRQEFPDLRRHYRRANRLWSGSQTFAGSAGGAPITVLRQYIEQQDRPA